MSNGMGVNGMEWNVTGMGMNRIGMEWNVLLE